MFASDKMTAASLRFETGSNKSYFIAAAIMAVAAIVRLELPMLDWMPYLTFFPAVVVVTLVCGGAAGLVSMLISLGIAWLLLMPAGLSFDDVYRSAMFTIGCCSVIFVAATVRHATALARQLNATLQQSETKFRGLLESAPDAMVIVDGTGRIALVNAAAERLFDYPRSRLLGETPDVLMMDSGSGDMVGKRQDGTLFPIEVSHNPLQTEDGAMISSAIRDVTARKDIEAELVRASRAKTDFLSGMSHELRTPLNAIVGFAELLQMKSGGDLTPKQQEYVGHILEGGQHLLVLVTQLLDLAGIEAGKLNLSVMPVDPAAILRYVHGLMSPLAQQAEIEFVIESPANIGDARADELRLRQVLINFLSNAIKYNRTGGRVVLSAEPVDGAVRFTVSDTGNGISPDCTKELFQPFNRLGAEHSKVAGTGIGLAYSRNVVEAMGGTVGFTSEVGKGSVFWVDLPAEPPPAAMSAPVPTAKSAFAPIIGDSTLSAA